MRIVGIVGTYVFFGSSFLASDFLELWLRGPRLQYLGPFLCLQAFNILVVPSILVLIVSIGLLEDLFFGIGSCTQDPRARFTQFWLPSECLATHSTQFSEPKIAKSRFLGTF